MTANNIFAFPCPGYHNPAGDFIYPEQGMSLRDWFASQAVITLLQKDYRNGPSIQEVADESYKIADALLIARDKKS